MKGHVNLRNLTKSNYIISVDRQLETNQIKNSKKNLYRIFTLK